MAAPQLAAEGVPQEVHTIYEQVQTRVVFIQVEMKYLAVVYSSEGSRTAFCRKRLIDQTVSTRFMTTTLALVQAQPVT